MHACLSASDCACACLSVCMSVCLSVCAGMCVCMFAFRVNEIWDWRPAPFYTQISNLKFVDKLELTVNCRRFFGGLFRFACCGRRLKNYIDKFPRVPGLSVPSLAANKEGRTFGDEKGYKWARCDGVNMQSLLF
jgi:hypothetical protein